MIHNLAAYAAAEPVLAFGAFFLLTFAACALSMRPGR